ncbi:MAG TPA: hypothetical protein VLZ07_01450, partial [Syntrophales bacterium]|nr:hypothetical protein [Syntrophales bacterium]
MREILTTRFNEIIARHLERLMGSAQAEGGLSLNMVTLGCLILLATKEIEIENFPDDAIDRYTFQTLQEEAALLGIECGKPLEMHLNDMIEKGYLKVDSEDKLIACKPAIAVTDTFDRIFPKMRSFNLLAYIGQTIEETVTGRTDIESATSRLDQTLRHHGVSLSTPIRASASARQQTDDRHGVRETIYENRRSREEILAELYGRGKSSENSARSASRPNRVIGGGTVLKSITVDGIIRKKELLKTEEAATAETDAKEEFPESPGPASPQSAPLSEQPLENEEVDIEIIDGPSPQPD